MRSEFQPFILDFCHKCGAILKDCEDWERPRWEDWDRPATCNHEAANHKSEEIENDNRSELEPFSYASMKARIFNF